MKPLTALLAILAGSAIALASGLIMTWIVILLLPQNEQRFAPEHSHLVRAIAVFTLFAAASFASFYSQAREERWRLAAHGSTVAVLALVLWLYWPT
ncbi:MAG TPA: hypothetical protein VMU44_08110 [Steroidobacteraceae bacterium]|nr:hypothetical protein [Steroidobacteraceae bacterium]